MNASITNSRLKELVKEVMVEENEYQAFFAKALEKAGKGINDMSEEEKKAFFNKVDSAWNGKGEKNESVNEGISVFDERFFGKKGIIIMIDDNGKKVSAIFKDKKNADKYNRNNPSDIKKLLDLAKKTKYPNAIDESVNERYTGNSGDKLKHKYDKNIEIELIEPTNKGWKVYQTDKGNKRKIAYFDKQDIVGNKSLFESVNEADVNWNAVQNAIINFLKMNTKILDKRVQEKDLDGVKGGLKSIISGLTNAQRSLKLESVNEDVSAELPKAIIPSAVKQKLELAIDKIKDAKLNPTQKLQLVAQVVDSLGIDKTQLGTIANKIRSKMESKK